MANISFKNVTKVFPSGKTAVKDFTLEIEHGEFLVLAGPSSSGKATILRMIAGTEPVTSGELSINGEIVENGKIQKRNVGMIFQNYTLYPGMTVRDNLSFSLEQKGMCKEDMDEAIRRTAEIFEIEHILSCYPRELSEYRKQQVAMARASVRNPIAFLILDSQERLAQEVKEKALKRLEKLHEKIGKTLVYVTETGAEAVRLNRRTVIMRQGQIVQEGPVKELLERPKDLFVAQYMNAPYFAAEEVQIRKNEHNMEALGSGFGVDVPKEWQEKLERNGCIGKTVLMGFSTSVIPDEDNEEVLPEGDSRLFFFDKHTQELLV